MPFRLECQWKGFKLAEKYYGWGFPVDISTNGAQIDNLIYIVHGLMAILFVGWMVFLVYALLRFRQRPGHEAEYKPHHHFKVPTFVEVAVAITEVVLLCAFSFPIWHQVKKEFPSKENSLEVRVVAEQFAWNIHYSGKDGIFGKTDPKLMNAMNPLGLDPGDLAGKDDITSLNQLHIPVNKSVIVHLSSKDVIHSFALPVMRVKQDAVPGQSIPIWFEATKAGNFEIACAQLCGLGHYRMRGFFMVEDGDKFSAWLTEQEAKKLAQAPAAV